MHNAFGLCVCACVDVLTMREEFLSPCYHFRRSAFAFGYGMNGQLGTGDKKPRAEPEQVPVPGHVVGISAGQFHSAACTSDGRTFVYEVTLFPFESESMRQRLQPFCARPWQVGIVEARKARLIHNREEHPVCFHFAFFRASGRDFNLCWRASHVIPSLVSHESTNQSWQEARPAAPPRVQLLPMHSDTGAL